MASNRSLSDTVCLLIPEKGIEKVKRVNMLSCKKKEKNCKMFTAKPNIYNKYGFSKKDFPDIVDIWFGCSIKECQLKKTFS